MAKVTGSFESVYRGVSQQVPQARRSGQMAEQVNMISDPVRGVVRRHGSQALHGFQISGSDMTVTQLAELARKYTTAPFHCNGKEYELFYAKEGVTGYPGAVPVVAYDKAAKQILPTVLYGGLANLLTSNGVSSLVNIGKFCFIAVNGFSPTYNFVTNMVDTAAQRDGVLWIRNGGFSRTYTLRLTMVDGQQVTVSYTTPAATYQGTLDTSDIPYDEAKPWLYQQEVANRTNAYNTAVTKHIAEATAAIAPDAIAKQLKLKLDAYISAGNVANEGAYVYWNQNANVAFASLDDGGDDSYARVNVHSVDAVEKLVPQAYNGMLMKVAAKRSNNKDAFYMRATTKDGSMFGEVVWKESAAQVIQPLQVFCVAYVHGGKLYIGGTPAELNAVTGGAANCPAYKDSVVGDSNSQPLPQLFGRQIDYLGVFQDRLIIGTGSTLLCSRPGDYFNWFRQTVLDVLDNDPIEMYALGSEDDTIKWDTSFDRNHVLFGRKFQYVLPGRVTLTPKNPSIQIMSANEDAVRAQPKSSGNFVFFAKDASVRGSVHQIQLGVSADTAEAYECSQQLDRYLKGYPIQLLCTTSPYNVFVRTYDMPNGFYVYSYLDAMGGGERLYDSWSRWEWNPMLGACMGIAQHQGDILCMTLRSRPGRGSWMFVDLFRLDTRISDYPYLDSWRGYKDVATASLWADQAAHNEASVAYLKSHRYYMLGSKWEDVGANMPWYDEAGHREFLTFGWEFESSLELTNPYLRDRNDKAITNGRLTLLNYSITLHDSGGLTAYREDTDRKLCTTAFDGRLLTRKQNIIGAAPILDTTVRVPVGKEVRECKVTLSAMTWLPFGIASIEWTGHWFNNARRV
ncbi:putative tail tubular B protein [Aeromonas phage Ahp1]|uniref:Putative tail tubular B protein n=1 Tax=Aeromonas phage Ahp1 TaxID=1747286 RepID=A0A1S5Q8E8_9CAUD|nr:tail protein [Aeromonas phage Ahp1]ALP47755.1 putative tail tubular B protein [Aeromonas phage Ahp1]